MESENFTPQIIQPGPELSEPPRKPWGAWSTIGLGVAIFAINSTFQVIALIIFSIILVLSRYTSNMDLNPLEFFAGLSTNGLLISVATIVSSIAGVGAAVLFIKLRKGITLSEYLGLKKISLKTVLALLGIVIGLLALVTVFNLFMRETQETDIMTEAYRNSVWPPLFWIAIVVFAPVFEEVLFRGFLFTGLVHSRLGAAWTIILTSLVFASLHLQYDLPAMAQIFILGVVLGVVRLKTGSLWSPIIVHAFWNFIQMIIMALYISGIGT